MWQSGAGRVRLSKSDKNIDVGGWQVDNSFEAVVSGDVLAHPRITNMHAKVLRDPILGVLIYIAILMNLLLLKYWIVI